MSTPIASKGELITLVEQLRPSNAAKAELMARISVSNPHLWLDGRPEAFDASHGVGRGREER